MLPSRVNEGLQVVWDSQFYPGAENRPAVPGGHDIALIKLKYPIKFNNVLRPIQLAPSLFRFRVGGG